MEQNAHYKIDAALGHEIVKTVVSGVDVFTPKDVKTVIPLVSWPWQTVSDAVLATCTAEPWAGHYSGSIVEMLMVLDFFNYISSDVKTAESHPLNSFNFSAAADSKFAKPSPKPTLSSARRKARAALASAYLIANGMHSANEVDFAVQLYLGTLTPSADRKAKCNASATDNISALMTGATATK